jgi:transposase-like protein
MADQRSSRRLTARRKTAVVLELLRTRASPQVLCQKHGIRSSDLAAWVYRFIEAGQRALEDPDERPSQATRRRAGRRTIGFPRALR